MRQLIITAVCNFRASLRGSEVLYDDLSSLKCMRLSIMITKYCQHGPGMPCGRRSRVEYGRCDALRCVFESLAHTTPLVSTLTHFMKLLCLLLDCSKQTTSLLRIFAVQLGMLCRPMNDSSTLIPIDYIPLTDFRQRQGCRTVYDGVFLSFGRSNGYIMTDLFRPSHSHSPPSSDCQHAHLRRQSHRLCRSLRDIRCRCTCLLVTRACPTRGVVLGQSCGGVQGLRRVP